VQESFLLYLNVDGSGLQLVVKYEAIESATITLRELRAIFGMLLLELDHGQNRLSKDKIKILGLSACLIGPLSDRETLPGPSELPLTSPVPGQIQTIKWPVWIKGRAPQSFNVSAGAAEEPFTLEHLRVYLKSYYLFLAELCGREADLEKQVVRFRPPYLANCSPQEVATGMGAPMDPQLLH